MGIFDKFSKKGKTEAEELDEKEEKLSVEDSENDKSTETAEEKSEKTEKKETIAPKAASGKAPVAVRRFTIVVEDVFQLKDGKGLVAGGNVHGTVNEGDKVYILHPILQKSSIVEIAAIEAGPMNMVSTATDCRVGIRIPTLFERKDIPRYSVITNIIPRTNPDPSRPAENPFLLGLTQEYGRLIREPAFSNLFTFAVFSSRYITPIKLDGTPENVNNGVGVLKQNTKIGFKLLHHPEDDSLHVLPVFTDWSALRMWKQAFDGEEQPKTLMMGFDESADIGLKNGGFVINPFGPAPVFVSKDNIKYTMDIKKNLDKKIDEENKKKAEADSKDSEVKDSNIIEADFEKSKDTEIPDFKDAD